MLLLLCAQAAESSISVSDLVRRAYIPLAALSPDGRLAAFLQVRADPIENVYRVEVLVVDVARANSASRLGAYRSAPLDTFDEGHSFMPRAGELRWVDADQLLFVTKENGRARLSCWNARDGTVAAITGDHDRIELERGGDPRAVPRLITTDFVRLPTSPDHPVDLGWRVLDGYRFYGPLVNPTKESRVQRRQWSLVLKPVLHPVLDSDGPIEPDEQPVEWSWFAPQTLTPDSETYLDHETASPDGLRTVAQEMRFTNLSHPHASRTSFRIVTREGSTIRALIPETKPFVVMYTDILDWSPQGTAVNYIFVGPRSSEINNVTLDGHMTRLLNSNELLSKPCPYAHHRCQIVSNDGRYVLLNRSSNVVPEELVRADLRTGSISVLAKPNSNFASSRQPEVRFYDIKETGGDAWGRLYLPLGYKVGNRYPLVITQYMSSPGFGADVGDEIPIPALVAAGIAVFDMNSSGLNQLSTNGDFDMEVARLSRPLNGMKWIVRELASRGIIDPSRVGVAGVSYGAEIALYAYWNWKELRAVSVATATWEPSSYYFGGVEYAHFLDRRGYSPPDESGLLKWRRVSAGLNARADLPPLLFQSPDAEETDTVAAWSQLRGARAPVEWYEYPGEGHVKVGPANKWWVFERNLDWFRFWLQHEEDPDPAKQAQYARWRSLPSGSSAHSCAAPAAQPRLNVQLCY